MRGGSTPPAATKSNQPKNNKKMKLTEQQQCILAERNRNIAERYCNLAEAQPLATANKIISYLANEYNLTPQSIGRILREQGITPTTQPVNDVQL